jgi:hypothetical protein
MDVHVAEMLSKELFVSRNILENLETDGPYTLKSGTFIRRKTSIYTLQIPSEIPEDYSRGKTIFIPTRDSLRRVAEWNYFSRSAWWKSLFGDIDLYVRKKTMGPFSFGVRTRSRFSFAW